jgi:Ca2+-transporting ATPase
MVVDEILSDRLVRRYCHDYTLSKLSNWSQPGDTWSPDRSTGRMLPQSLSLTTLMCMGMLNSLSAVSVDNSLLRVGPKRLQWLALGVSGPCLLYLFVLYSSRLGLPAAPRKLWNGTNSSSMFGNDLSVPPINFAFLTSIYFLEPFAAGNSSMDDWTRVLAWAAPILLVDEMLKAAGRFSDSKRYSGVFQANGVTYAQLPTGVDQYLL